MSSDTQHPWQSAVDEFDKITLPKLKKIGKLIGKDAQNGNQLALEIINTYSLLWRSFDPLTYFRLKEALEKYETQTHLPH